MTQLTTATPHRMFIGDRITFAEDSNRVRRKIDGIFGNTICSVETHIRPSRGYAKHIRSIKHQRSKQR